MTELAILALSAAWLVLALARRAFRPSTPAAAPQASYRLNIEGVAALEGNPRFVSKFGLSPRLVKSIGYLDGPGHISQFPAQARDCLYACYQHGQFRGAGIAGVLFKHEPVQPGTALYFVLCRSDNREMNIFAFLAEAPAQELRLNRPGLSR